MRLLLIFLYPVMYVCLCVQLLCLWYGCCPSTCSSVFVASWQVGSHHIHLLTAHSVHCWLQLDESSVRVSQSVSDWVCNGLMKALQCVSKKLQIGGNLMKTPCIRVSQSVSDWVCNGLTTECLQLLEILKIYWNLISLLEILEISGNLIGLPGQFLWRRRNFLQQVGLIAG